QPPISSPRERKYQAVIVHRRVRAIHVSVSRPVASAATANAKGTVNPVKPRYRAIGCVIIPVSSSSGLSPRPSGGVGLGRRDGGAAIVMTERKNASTPSITASAHG